MNSYLKPVAASLFLAFAAPSMAATATWTFDLPATAIPSQDPPYPSVTTLTLTDVSGGVQFVLDPAETNPGYTTDSTVNRLDYVYSGAALTDASFQYDSGAMIKTFSYETNQAMDAGYAADDQHIIVNWFTGPDSFMVSDTSTWTVLGTTLDDFTNTFGTSNSKPSPISAVVSVDPFHNPDMTPNPSNWVTMTAPIPEPETYAMLLAGLGMLGFVGKRRCNKTDGVGRV
jgi:hypothetical protein